MRMLFSEAFHQFLSRAIAGRLQIVESLRKNPDLKASFPVSVGAPTAELSKYALSQIIDADLKRIPPSLQEEYRNALLDAGKRFLDKHDKQIAEFLKLRKVK